METKFSIWRGIFYGSLTTIMIWLLLKIVGIIQTPIWLEYGVPIGSAVFAMLSFHKDLLENIIGVKVDLATVTVKVEHLDKDIECIKKDLGLVKSDIEIVKTKVNDLDKDMHIVKRKINVC